jgi:hypothetical protein
MQLVEYGPCGIGLSIQLQFDAQPITPPDDFAPASCHIPSCCIHFIPLFLDDIQEFLS